MALTTARRQILGAGMAVVATACVAAHAQMPIGSVSTLDATVTGASSVANDRAQLGTNGTVVAKDHVAFVQLIRGGSVKVCATSGVHLTAGTPSAAPPDAGPSPTAPGIQTQGDAAALLPAPTTWAANIPPPLMVALDRGAMELRMGAISGDVLMTPDLRFNFSGDGQLDVHIRVGRNGDTCVENRVSGLSGHPALKVGSLFGDETYDVLPGQHVLFEAGNLHEVVDNESSPCGCPEASAKPLPLAISDIALKGSSKITSTQAAEQHPFPAEVSQGLAPAPVGASTGPRTQIATTLAYNSTPDGSLGNSSPTTTPRTTHPAAGDSTAPVAKTGFFHSIGRLFKRIF